MLGRLVTVLASVIAVSVALGTGLDWLAHHSSHRLFSTITLWALALAGGAVSLHPTFGAAARLSYTRSWQWTVAVGTALSMPLCLLALLLVIPHDLPNLTYEAYASATMAAVVVAVATSMYDSFTHTECPDCSERIKVTAHVCRHCGKRFDDVPITMPPFDDD